jgi:Concanavalin A-like lectin/glucanases superfamily
MSGRGRLPLLAAAVASGIAVLGLTAAPASAVEVAAARGMSAGDPGLRAYQTPQQASAQAARTGRAVQVTGSTTPTSTLTANPNGTFTLTESTAPVRTKVGGTWRNLDASLVRNSDGTWSPAVSSHPLTLSGGGTGPLATMTYGTYSLALTAPMRLPAPVIAGDTATYTGVLPGVDLIVTAQPSGGFSEVLRIATATAAANPALQALTFTTRTRGLTLKSAGNGVISALTKAGQVIFAAPAPQMWDSANTPGPSAVSGSAVAPGGKAAVRAAVSTAAGPGAGAHTARLGVSLAGGRITLSPDRQLLTGPGAVYPEYLDPTWDSAGSSASSWAYVSEEFPGQEYYDTDMTLQVGQDPDDTSATSYSFYTLPLPSQVDGAVIDTAYAYFPEVWADSCTASPVQLWLTGTISGSTTWDSQPAWDSELGSDDVAYGWSPDGYAGGPPPSGDAGCGDNDVAYTITSTVKTAAADSWPTVTVGLRASDTSDSTGWKQFADPDSSPSGNATLSITYANSPATPVLTTSPAASCAAGTSVLGNGNVSLDAAVSDKNGTATGSLTVAYTAYADGNTADTFDTSLPASVSAASGTSAALILPAADLDNAVNNYGSDDQVSITWTATVSDGLSGVPSSATASCTFIFSTAVPGMPQIFDSAGNPGCHTLSYTAGTPASFTLEPNGTSSAATEPTAYIYQLNGGNSVTVPASSSSPYSAAISVTPAGFTNILTVEATAAGGNIGQPASCVINAAAPGPAVDQDLTGDGVPDLLTVGSGTTGTAAGLWLADGQGNSNSQFDGTVDTTATDIAPLGPQDTATSATSAASGTPGAPANWNGWKAITGEFTDSGFNDVEAYQPTTGDVYVLAGNGNGTIDTSQGLNLTGAFDDINYVGSGEPIYPKQLVNAYNVSGDNEPYPDQIGLFDDPTAGAYLAYFENDDSDVSFDAANCNDLPYELTNTTPDGSMDWTDWTITISNNTPGASSGTDMWLWDQTTGALWLWELTGLSGQSAGESNFNLSTGTSTCTPNPTATLNGTLTEISADWNQDTTLNTLQATELNGEPGLITVTSTGQVQSWYLDNGTTLTQANSTQQLLTAAHAYLLNEQSSGAVATAADQPGAGDTEQDLTGVGGATWNSGDPVFSPDVALNGTSAYLTTDDQAGVLAPASSFTVSAWVNPSALGGTVFSQDGTDDSSVEVSSTASGQWSVSMNTGGTTTGTYATASGGTAHAGVWANLTLTYDAVGGADILELYANGVEVAYLRDTTPPTTTGDFVLGASESAGGDGSFYSGQLADVQVWDDLATPVQPASPASAFVPVTPVRIMDTRSASRIGPVTGPVAAGSSTLVPIDGNTIASLPASGITAVAVSITVTAQTAAGDLVAYPADTPLPATSTVNFASAGATTNNAIVPVGPDGDIAIYNGSAGTTQLIVDLTGYFTTDTTATGASTYTPLADPTRVLDTRNGTGAPEAEIASGGTLTLTMAGDDTNGVDLPATGLTAVALNLTVVPTATGDAGDLATYPDGVTRPNTSNLWYNATAGQAQAGTIIIPVGSDGKIDIYNDGAAVNLVGDLSGYFTTSTTGQYYHPLNSTRIIDTRQTTALASDSTRTIADPGNILADNPTLVLNITVTGPADGGYLQAYPGSAARPTSSIVDFAAGETVANLALVNTSDGNSFTVLNDSAGTVQLVIDTDGYFE